jgi:pantothenate kinase-related protein Tda10
MKKFIAVAGNIGVGKSTLVEMISPLLDCQPFYEPVTEFSLADILPHSPPAHPSRPAAHPRFRDPGPQHLRRRRGFCSQPVCPG